jgi:hypothetical protein
MRSAGPIEKTIQIRRLLSRIGTGKKARVLTTSGLVNQEGMIFLHPPTGYFP